MPLSPSPSPFTPLHIETGARARLRSATREAHARAEASPPMAALFDGRLDLPGYAALLTALHGWFREWETTHTALLHRIAAAGWRYASRTDPLARDLAALAATPPAAPTPVTTAACTATAWGMLYVIEGSTLGARLICARLRACLGDALPCAYFSLGAAEPRQWRRFERQLERALATPAQQHAAIAGAHVAFAEMTVAMDSCSA